MTGDGGDELVIEPVTVARMVDLDELFARGDPRWCQCAYMRLANVSWSTTTPEANRAVHRQAIEEATAQGRSAGLIAYRGGRAVGWVSFDRRDAYGRLASSSLLRPVDDRDVWSVVCFVVAASARRSGVASTLLGAAVDDARDHGVRLVEAYPVDVSTAPGTRRAAAALWRGTVPMFERAGFTTVAVRRQHAGAPPRPIMRRRIRPRRPPS